MEGENGTKMGALAVKSKFLIDTKGTASESESSFEATAANPCPSDMILGAINRA